MFASRLRPQHLIWLFEVKPALKIGNTLNEQLTVYLSQMNTVYYFNVQCS